MFNIAFLVGIYSYIIFFLGLFGLLYNPVLIGFTVGCIGVYLFIQRKRIFALIQVLRSIQWKNKHVLLLTGLFVLQIFINFLGALGPPLAFDEVWYHLTLPKLWLLHHYIFFIPGGLLYYSVMPKFAELLYTAGLAFGSGVIPQLIHFVFGLLVCVVIYKIARMFLTPFFSFLAVIMFYLNIIVAWESTTAYIDLVRTFFEVMALWGFFVWWKNAQWKWVFASALLLGFAIMTKLLAMGSLVLFSGLIVYSQWNKIPQISSKILLTARYLLVYWVIALVVPLPWFIFSYIHTGNPVYPFFTSLYPVVPSHFSILGFFVDIWHLFTHADDPVSPLYLIFLPLIIMLFLKGNLGKKSEIKLLGIYALLALIVWYVTPRTGGGRFIIPYLPAFSILCAAVMSELQITNRKAKNSKNNFLFTMLLGVTIFISITSLVYRGAATVKYLPVVFGKESKSIFLTKHLNFSFGDFYDIDNYFKTHIKSTDVVLLYGFHNLYYVNFPFIDSSWVKKDDKFNFVAVQNAKLPARFKNWHLVYKNDKTLVQLYAPPKGECSPLCKY